MHGMQMVMSIKKYGSNSSETVDMVFGLDYGDVLMVEAKLDVKNAFYQKYFGTAIFR